MRTVVLASVLLAVPAIAAQQRAGSPDVVVTGERRTPEQVRREAAVFVRALGVANGSTPAARWVDPVCPRVLGLSAGHAAVVEAKVRAVAIETGVPLAPSGCRRANVVVQFATQADGVVRRLATKSPGALSEASAPMRARLLDPAPAVRWWYRTTTRGDGGMDPASTPAPWVQVGGTAAANPLPSNGDTGINQEYGNSIISTKAQRVLRSATVIVDVDRATGLPLDTAASYAALVALAEVELDDPPPPGSLLETFSTVKPRHPTARDLAFLRALYRLPLARAARTHRATLAREIAAAELGRTTP